MKIALTVHGTRGDIQPFVPVALALLERGHDVSLGVPPNLMAFVQKCGVPAEKIAIDSQAFLESEEGRAWLAAGNVSAFMKRMIGITHTHRDELIEDYRRICEGADVIVAGVLTEDHVASIAEAKGIPLVALHLAPIRATDAFPCSIVTTRTLPFRFLTRGTYALLERLWWGGFREDVNILRQRLGLAPTNMPTVRRLAERGSPTVHAFSPHLVPPPPDWGEEMPVVGAIRFPAVARQRLGEATPDPDLAAWLRQGSPPIYFGLGSMPVRDPVAMLQTVDAVTNAIGARAVIGAGWSRLDAAAHLPEHVRIVGAVDHGWLLPRCSAAVHHGGAGTTFAVLDAGLPAVVASVFADQPFWAARLERLGVGAHLPFRKLGPVSLEKALRRALEPDMKAEAARLGAEVRAEPDGTPAIVKIVESMRRPTRSAA